MTEKQVTSDSGPPPEPDGGIAVSVGLKLVQSIMFVYDFLTFPLYFAIQQPWKNTEAMASIRANPVNKTKTSVTYQPIEKSCPPLEEFKVRFSNDPASIIAGFFQPIQRSFFRLPELRPCTSALILP